MQFLADDGVVLAGLLEDVHAAATSGEGGARPSRYQFLLNRRNGRMYECCAFGRWPS